MKRSTEILGGAAFTLFFTALAGWFFCLAKISVDFSAMYIDYVWLALAALAAFAVNSLLMRRGAALQLFLIVQILMIAAGAFLFVHSVALEPHKTRTVVLNCIIYCITFPVTGYIAYEAPKKNGLLILFDLSACGIAILLLLDRVLGLPAARSTIVMGAIALAVTLLALISERAGRYHAGQENVRGSGVGGKVLLGILFAAVVGLTAAVAAVASVGIRRVSEGIVAALRWIWGVILAALKFIYRMIEDFFEWLSQFMKDEPVEAIAAPEMGGSYDFTAEEVQMVLPPWVTWAAIALGVLLLAFILWRLRKRHFNVNVRRVLRKPVSARRENGAGEALRELLNKLWAELRFRWACVFRRNTAPGLLVWCEHKASKADARRAGESGEAFLLRLSEKPECAPLRELASLVERTFYAPNRVEVPRELCRTIRKIKFT